jgi:hypothetical protein
MLDVHISSLPHACLRTVANAHTQHGLAVAMIPSSTLALRHCIALHYTYD